MNTVATNTVGSSSNNNRGEIVMKHQPTNSTRNANSINGRSKREMKKPTGLTVLVVCCMLLGFAPCSQAAHIYWSGLSTTDNSDWHDKTNWVDADGSTAVRYPGEGTALSDFSRIEYNESVTGSNDYVSDATINISQALNMVPAGTNLVDADARILVGSPTAGHPATLNITADVTARNWHIGDDSTGEYAVVNHTSGAVEGIYLTIGKNAGAGLSEYHFGSEVSGSAPSASFGYGIGSGDYRTHSHPIGI